MSTGRRRVAVTGLGLITPLGNDLATNWDALCAGRSGIRSITRFDASALPVRIAAEVRDFDAADWFDARELKRSDRFCHFAVAAAEQAVQQSGLLQAGLGPDDIGVIVGSAMGGITAIEETVQTFLSSGARRVSPFFVPRMIANVAAGQIAMRYGLRGTNYCTTSACASGAHAIGEAFRLVRDGYQEAMVAGGAEGGVTPMTIAGFAAMRTLAAGGDDPATACRPFDRDRQGLVVGEGAGVVVLESLDGARRRGAAILGEIVGYGCNADAHHLTTPSPAGIGAAKCMARALADGGIATDAVDHINAHGTGTEMNDLAETQAIKTTFGAHAYAIAVNSTKSMTGHTLGAAGGIEAVFVVLSLAHQVVPPTINLHQPDVNCDLDYVPLRARPATLRIGLSNSFGFGGANASLAFRRVDRDGGFE